MPRATRGETKETYNKKLIKCRCRYMMARGWRLGFGYISYIPTSLWWHKKNWSKYLENFVARIYHLSYKLNNTNHLRKNDYKKRLLKRLYFNRVTSNHTIKIIIKSITMVPMTIIKLIKIHTTIKYHRILISHKQS